jgi:type IV fimbrial biogenesis protein FimT
MRLHLYRGFSLFELLITLSIVIILLLVVVPNEKHFITKSQDEVLSQQMLRAIYLARNEAVARSTTVTLCPSEDLKTCSGDWLRGYIILADNKVLAAFQNVTNQGAIHWRSFPNGRENLKFSGLGNAEVENGTFWYCENTESNAHWAIVMSQSGRARLEQPDAAGKVLDSNGNELPCFSF